MCGGVAYIPLTNATAVTRTIKDGFTYYDKCTWVVKTNGKGAPTFKAEKAVTGNSGVMSSKWDLHYIEYSLKGTGVTMTNMTG